MTRIILTYGDVDGDNDGDGDGIKAEYEEQGKEERKLFLDLFQESMRKYRQK